MNPVTEETISAEVDRVMHAIDRSQNCEQMYETVKQLFVSFQSRFDMVLGNLQMRTQGAAGDIKTRELQAEGMRLAIFLVSALLSRLRAAIDRDYPRTEYCSLGFHLTRRYNVDLPELIRNAFFEITIPIRDGIDDYATRSSDIHEMSMNIGTFFRQAAVEIEQEPQNAERVLEYTFTLAEQAVDRAKTMVDETVASLRRLHDSNGILEAFYIRDLEHMKTSIEVGEQHRCQLYEKARIATQQLPEIRSRLEARYGHVCGTTGQAFGRRRNYRRPGTGGKRYKKH